jgi:hypothetical protein
MNSGIAVTRQFHVGRGRNRCRDGCTDARTKLVPQNVPRISRLMAIAIYLDQLVRDGTVKDQAELARLGHVSRARLTQIMNLLNLAPEFQNELLKLEPLSQGRDRMTERFLRVIVAEPNWRKQRRMWSSRIK